MKKIVLSFIAIAGFAFTASAQTALPASRPQMARALLDVAGMQTEEQFLKIKPALSAVKGVVFTNVNLTSHQVVFSYDPSIVTAAQLSEIVKANGYENKVNLTTEKPAPAPESTK